MSNPAKNYLNRQAETEMVPVHLTKRQIKHLKKWAESLDISFEDAAAFAIHLGLQDTGPAYWDEVV